MDSAEPKDGSYQEPQISQTVVRKLGTSEAFGSDDEARALCVNGKGGRKSESDQSSLAQEARAMTATPICKLGVLFVGQFMRFGVLLPILIFVKKILPSVLKKILIWSE